MFKQHCVQYCLYYDDNKNLWRSVGATRILEALRKPRWKDRENGNENDKGPNVKNLQTDGKKTIKKEHSCELINVDDKMSSFKIQLLEIVYFNLSLLTILLKSDEIKRI